MTTLQIFWLVLGSSWTVLEILIAYKTRAAINPSQILEVRSERFIWIVVISAVLAALFLKHWQLLPLPFPVMQRQVFATLLFCCGLSLRAYAVWSLGIFFSTSVITQSQHLLIEHGPYRLIRHPAYSGLLCSFFAAGIAMGDLLACVTLVLPIAWILIQRMHIEEQMLLTHFGLTYQDYCGRTFKILPGIF